MADDASRGELRKYSSVGLGGYLKNNLAEIGVWEIRGLPSSSQGLSIGPNDGYFDESHPPTTQSRPARLVVFLQRRRRVNTAEMTELSGLLERGTGLRAVSLLLGSQGPEAKLAEATGSRSLSRHKSHKADYLEYITPVERKAMEYNAQLNCAHAAGGVTSPRSRVCLQTAQNPCHSDPRTVVPMPTC